MASKHLRWPAIEALGADLKAIRAVILTHHHGPCRHCRASEVGRGRPLVGGCDAWIVGGKYPAHANPGFYRQSWRPNLVRFLVHSAAVGGAKYRPVKSVEALTEDQTLDLPGRPRVIHTPGQHRGPLFGGAPRARVLFTGDAMASFDYATGRRGLKQHRFNDDRAVALVSLGRLDPIDAEVVLVAHGDPWTKGLPQALEIVRGTEE